MPSHKRPLIGSSTHERDITLQPPKASCLACGDSGIITNSDGMIRQYLADYDLLPDGTSIGGGDCSVICHCSAAYGEMDHDGKVIRGGYRHDSGDIRTVDTEQGPRFPGVELPRHAIQEIHQRRKASWLETCQEINRARHARATGQDPKAMPWFLQELADMIRSMKEQQAKLELQRVEERGRQMESLGSLLGDIDPTVGTDAA